MSFLHLHTYSSSRTSLFFGLWQVLVSSVTVLLINHSVTIKLAKRGCLPQETLEVGGCGGRDQNIVCDTLPLSDVRKLMFEAILTVYICIPRQEVG
jgi:hypothetical protein